MPGQERQTGLRSVALRGAVRVDPAAADVFRRVIEQRKSLPPGLSTEVDKRLDAFLRVLANTTSYGILAELNRQELPAGSEVAGESVSLGPSAVVRGDVVRGGGAAVVDDEGE